MKKFQKSDFNVKTAGLPEEQKQFMENILDMMCDVMNKSLEGSIDKDEVEKQFKGINDQLKSYDGEAFAQLKKDNEELLTQVKNLGETIEKLQSKGMSMDAISKFDEKLNEMLDSDKFQDFAAGRTSKSGSFEGFSLKEVSMTSNYVGNLLITEQQNRVVSQAANKRVHMRDVLTTLQGDAEFPQLAFAQIYDVDRNARYVTENGTLPESSFKVKEQNYSTKRLGTHIRLSKRMLKSRAYVRSFILNMLPEAVLMAEDWNILYGDGNGENLLGIVNHIGVTSVENIIGGTIITGAAGAVSGLSSANGGQDTIVEFTNAYDLMLDGMKITFAGATSSTVNATFDVIKMNDRQILLKGLAYVAEASPDNISFTVNNGAFKSIDEPNSGDVVRTAFAVMSYAQYTPNAIQLNPITVNAIASEKDSMGHNLGLVTIEGGVKKVAGYPVVENSSIPAGGYCLGDFHNGANLVDYTALTLEWAEDVESKLKNQVVLIAQEEVIFPVYNPWAFAYGNLEALKTAITKATESTESSTPSSTPSES